MLFRFAHAHIVDYLLRIYYFIIIYYRNGEVDEGSRQTVKTCEETNQILAQSLIIIINIVIFISIYTHFISSFPVKQFVFIFTP